MNTLKVELGERSYPILIGEGLLRQPDLVRQHVPAQDILIVSNTTVAPLYMESLAGTLAGARVVEVILPDGESHKVLATVSRVLDVLVANRFSRDCTVVALGGGTPMSDIRKIAKSAAVTGCFQPRPARSSTLRNFSPCREKCVITAKAPIFISAYAAR